MDLNRRSPQLPADVWARIISLSNPNLQPSPSVASFLPDLEEQREPESFLQRITQVRLPRYRGFFAFPLVCKALRDVTEPILFSHIELRTAQSSETLLARLRSRNGGSVKSLSFSHSDAKQSNHSASGFDARTDDQRPFPIITLPIFYFKSLFHLLPQLTYLDLSGVHPPKERATNTHILTSLALKDPPLPLATLRGIYLSPRNLDAVALALSSVAKTLRFVGVSEGSFKGEEGWSVLKLHLQQDDLVLPRFPQLEYIDYVCAGTPMDPMVGCGFYSLLGRAETPNLQKLSLLTFANRSEEFVFKSIEQLGPRVRSLQTSVSILDDPQTRDLAQFPNLHELVVEPVEYSPDIVLPRPPRLPHFGVKTIGLMYFASQTEGIVEGDHVTVEEVKKRVVEYATKTNFPNLERIALHTSKGVLWLWVLEWIDELKKQGISVEFIQPRSLVEVEPQLD